MKLKESKKHLMLVSKFYDKYSEEEIKRSYEDADGLRVELAIRENRNGIISEEEMKLKSDLKEPFALLRRQTTISQLECRWVT